MAGFDSLGVRSLAKARSSDKKLTSVKKDPDATNHDAAAGSVASLADALSSVVPVAVSGVYTTVALVLRGISETRGVDARTKLEAALAASHKTRVEIAAALKALPSESRDLITWRWAFLVLAAIAVIYLTVNAVRTATAGTAKHRNGASETIVAVVAFAGWSLATPGTPLAAYHDPQNLVFFTVLIAGAATLVLAAAGTVLTKPAK